MSSYHDIQNIYHFIILKPQNMRKNVRMSNTKNAFHIVCIKMVFRKPVVFKVNLDLHLKDNALLEIASFIFYVSRFENKYKVIIILEIRYYQTIISTSSFSSEDHLFIYMSPCELFRNALYFQNILPFHNQHHFDCYKLESCNFYLY